MTKEEIKEHVNMPEVLSRYGIQVIRGMCRCPFHDDRKPSMKVYRDGVRCFTCAKSWDIFGFIQDMDHVDFRTAFISLGGTYERQTDRDKIIAKMRREAAQRDRDRKRKTNKEMFNVISTALFICQNAGKVYAPYSDEWCELKNKLPLVEYFYDTRIIDNKVLKEMDDINVYRECRSIINRFLPTT